MVQALEYEDSPISAGYTAMGGDSATYYYAVTSVDAEGDESVRSAALSPPAAGSGGGSGGGVCFVSAAQFDLAPYIAQFQKLTPSQIKLSSTVFPMNLPVILRPKKH
jgi:hypothetical protein